MQRPNIMKAAKAALQDKIPAMQAARQYGVTVTSVSEALLILNLGTPEEKATVMEYPAFLSMFAKAIRKTMTPEQSREYKRSRQSEGEILKTRDQDIIALGAQLKLAIKALSEFPDPAEMVQRVAKHGRRELSIDNYVETANKWLEEFTNEWRKHKRTKSPDNTADAGNGDQPAGAQHTKSAA